MQSLSVFVYGTLKPGEANFDRYCGSKVMSSQPAFIYGTLYDFPALGYPGAVWGVSKISGYVLSFADPEILRDLDRLEDYDPDRDPSKNEYDRQLVTAYYLFDRQVSTREDLPLSISAWAYFMNPETVRTLGGILVPSGCWDGSRSR